jgi:hypothetical protein
MQLEAFYLAALILVRIGQQVLLLTYMMLKFNFFSSLFIDKLFKGQTLQQ